MWVRYHIIDYFYFIYLFIYFYFISGRCLSYMDNIQMMNLQRSFWGKRKATAKGPAERTKAISTIWSTCHAFKV